MNEFITKNVKETKQVAAKIAQTIFQMKDQIKKQENKRGATILALNGDLGSGKTIFVQGFAKELKIKELILSPTFIIFRKFRVQLDKFEYLYHFDLYRIKDKQELEVLGFQEIISNSQNIVLIEWADKIRDILPPDTIFINFKLIDKKTREIIIKNLLRKFF